MTPERRQELRAWLQTAAEAEEVTASVLSRLPAGNPAPCRINAGIYRELLAHLDAPEPTRDRPTQVATSRKLQEPPGGWPSKA